MYGKCENCLTNNYLTEFKHEKSLAMKVCARCFTLLNEGKMEFEKAVSGLEIKEKIREALGKLGEY